MIYRVHWTLNISNLSLVKTTFQLIFKTGKLRFKEVHLESKCTIIDLSTHEIIAKICFTYTS